MKTIWRYDFPLDDEVTLEVPAGSHFLPHVEAKGISALTVWALVNTTAPMELRVLRVVGTGNPALGVSLAAHLGTVVTGPYVWHVFEATR